MGMCSCYRMSYRQKDSHSCKCSWKRNIEKEKYIYRFLQFSCKRRELSSCKWSQWSWKKKESGISIVCYSYLSWMVKRTNKCYRPDCKFGSVDKRTDFRLSLESAEMCSWLTHQPYPIQLQMARIHCQGIGSGLKWWAKEEERM